MFKAVARTSVMLLAAASLAAAQQPQSQKAGSFQSGGTYAGPHVWLGNLNGSLAVGAQAERAITEPGKYGSGMISAGVGIDYYSWHQEFGALAGKWSYSVIPLQAFSNYHFAIKSNPKLDPYVGLGLVYSIVHSSWDGGTITGSSGASGSSLAFAGQGGLRYFLKESFALQAQVGFGYGTLGLGTSWKF